VPKCLGAEVTCPAAGLSGHFDTAEVSSGHFDSVVGPKCPVAVTAAEYKYVWRDNRTKSLSDFVQVYASVEKLTSYNRRHYGLDIGLHKANFSGNFVISANVDKI